MRYVIPVFGCVAVMTAFGGEALARERSHHHHWTSKHSHHHSLRGHAVSHHARRGRSIRRHVVLAQPYAPTVAQQIEAPFAWQSPQPMMVPVVRQRRGQRLVATPGPWQSTTVQRPAVAVVPQQSIQHPYAPSYGWQAPVQQPSVAPVARRRVAPASPPQGQFASLVSTHAQANGVPESLVHRVIMRESRYNSRAVSRGNYGIMQIRLGTARAMGYTGSAAGLLDPNTNMTYAVRYLAGAYRAAGGNHNRAMAYYAGGFYYAAKRQGFSPYATQARVVAPAAAATPVRAMVQPVGADVF
jgi:soluble lytic murein transglycosylase-like protein